MKFKLQKLPTITVTIAGEYSQEDTKEKLLKKWLFTTASYEDTADVSLESDISIFINGKALSLHSKAGKEIVLQIGSTNRNTQWRPVEQPVEIKYRYEVRALTHR